MVEIDRRNTPIRQDRFTLPGNDPSFKFEGWGDLTSSGLEIKRQVSGGLPQSKNPFLIDAVRYDLGNVQFADVKIGARQFRRTEQHLGKYWLDPWVLLFRKKGSLTSQSGDRVMKSSAGSLSFESYAYAFSGSADDTDTLVISVPRENFPQLADRLDRINHTLIKGVAGTLLSQFMLSLESYLPTMVLNDIPVVNESLSVLVRSLLMEASQYSMDEHPAIAASLFDRARKYIEVNIASPSLSPEAIARDLGVSQRTLYYIFETQGGVVNYIRNRRLAACYSVIANPAEVRPIHEIAEQFGLTNRAQFSRQFRSQYGHSPNEVREAKLLEYVSRKWAPRTFEEWIKQVSRA